MALYPYSSDDEETPAERARREFIASGGFGSSTTIPSTTVPSTTIPSAPSVSRPSRPASVRTPRISRAEVELENLSRRAQNLGLNVPSTVAPASEEEDNSWWEDLLGMGAKAAITTGGAVLGAITLPGRVIASTGAELGQGIADLAGITPDTTMTRQPRASFTEWYKQILDPSFGMRQAMGIARPSNVALTPELLAARPELQAEVVKQPDVLLTGNKWADRVITFAGDVAYDPLNYLTPGGGALAKTITAAGSEVAAREVTEALAKEGVESLVRRGASRDAVEFLAEADATWAGLQMDLATASKNLREANAALSTSADAVNAARVTDLATEVSRIQMNIDRLEFGAKVASDEIAMSLGTKGGRILQAEERRIAAAQKWAALPEGSEARRIAAKELDRATEDLVRMGGKKVARRQYRAAGREQLAESARLSRQFALKKISDPNVIGTPAWDFYNSVAETLTDDVIKSLGTRGWNAVSGDVAKVLGSAERSRIGIGRLQWFIPGSERVTRAFGGAAVATRLKALSTPLGQRLVDIITPLGRKGIFSDLEVLSWRRALQSGKVTPENAVRYTALLDAQKQSIIRANAQRRAVGSVLRSALKDITEDDARQIRSLLENPDLLNRRPGWPALDKDLLFKYQKVKGVLDSWYGEANSKVKEYGGQGLAFLGNYFPHAQTEDAIRWIRNNPDLADNVAANLGVDRQFLSDNFVRRELKEGSNWFGRILTDDDIKGGVARLNEIARDPNYGALDFDFFETDLRKALAKYGYTHATFMANLESAIELSGRRALSNLPAGPGFRMTGVESYSSALEQLEKGAYEVARERTLQYVAMSPNAVSDVMTSLDDVIGAMIGEPDVLKYMSEESLQVLNGLLSDLVTKYQVATGELPSVGGMLQFKMINPDDVVADVLAVLDEIDQFRTLARNAKEAIEVEADQGMMDWLAQNLSDSWKIRLEMLTDDILESQDQLAKTLDNVSDIQWSTVGRMIDEGWEKSLTVGNVELADVAVNKELNQVFKNVKKVSDPSAARNLEDLIGRFNSFFKTYATATPRFHIRNAISNTFMLLAAGVDLSEAKRSLKIYSEFFGANRARVIANRPLVTPEEFVRGLRNTSVSEKRLILQALETTDTSSGAFVEALGKTSTEGYELAESGKPVRNVINRTLGPEAVGISGRVVPSDAKFKTVRRLAGSLLTGSKAVGSAIENSERFILTYDGLKKGLRPVEALARTNKYLFDYADLSRADRLIKQIIPFWYWMSRNLPLQIELMLTEPKTYSRYADIRRNLQGENQPDYLPQYMRRAGAFQIQEDIPVIGGMIAQPELGFPGGGTPSPLMALIQGAAAAAGGDETTLNEAVRQGLGTLSPIFRIPIEYGTSTNLFTGRQIGSGDSTLSAGKQRWLYALGQAFGAPAWLANTINYIRTLSGNPKWIPNSEEWQILLRLNPPVTENMTPDEILRRQEEERSRFLAQYTGLPFSNLTEQQQLSEIARRRRILEDMIAREQNRRAR